eukprot:TRINITY_DN6231_c0_g1_i1.p1 TRINITY_DN6231_c0_g1~~TRINITY_DN6231_c0_g1_i1.p1  ORF type:complete len:340 (+),score=65.70 TRINITY_DN6231_c0_g1_i1:80-1099(+)
MLRRLLGLKGTGSPSPIQQPITPSPTHRPRPHTPGVEPHSRKDKLPFKHVIAVSSAKGGVGKSTTAVNLAVAFRLQGKSVGLLDADLYGPSIPKLMNLSKHKAIVDPRTQYLLPLENHGIRCMSSGFLMDENQAIIWRGPLIIKMLHQLLYHVQWVEPQIQNSNQNSTGDLNHHQHHTFDPKTFLDLLVVDLPPGTGDTHLSIVQNIPLSGAVIVSTPQDLALIDARRGVEMFKQVNVPILGMIENMSYHICNNCGHSEEIFGRFGVENTCKTLGLPFLAALPLHKDIRISSDEGRPIVISSPESVTSQQFNLIAAKILDVLQQTNLQSASTPKITFQE